MTPKTRAAMFVVALSALLLATGCGGGKPSARPDASPSHSSVASEDPVTKADAAPADPDVAGGLTADTGGSDATSGPGLPDGFPGDAIPVVRGSVVGGTKGEPGGPYAYTLLLQVDGASPAAVLKRVTVQLQRAGFTATPGMTMDEMSTATFTSATYAVGVNAVKGSGMITVTYVVKKR